MHGQLFTSDFLREGIRATPGWDAAETGFATFREMVSAIFSRVSADTVLNEAQTEDELILPVLAALGWDQYLRQQTASRVGRADVPDFLLFDSVDTKRAARDERQADRRYRHGALIVEAKRWRRPLDRGDGNDPFDTGTPSSQMLRYLSRAEVASDRALQWGILTNGAIWRLYWQSARSRAEEFLEFDLSRLTLVAGVTGDMFAPADADQVHYLRAFYLLFRREAFRPQPDDARGRSFHAIALEEGRLWESKVSQDLGERVFNELFPDLVSAIARHDGAAQRPYTREYLDAVHRAALILLYRLLFVLYAEDRNLLPAADTRYDDYSLRWLRNDIATRVHRGDVFSASASKAWQHLRSLFRAIDRGDDSIGLPPYNGGLFHEAPADILARIELPDAELVPIIDGLSRRAAGVTVNPENVHRPAQPFEATETQHRDPDFVPPPQFFVDAQNVREQMPSSDWILGFKHVSAPTNVRTMIAAICPVAGFGNSLPLFAHEPSDAPFVPLLLANLNSLCMDYVLRQKLQGQNLNLFVVEQLPLIAPEIYAQPLGSTTIGDFVRFEVLRLSYTANDLAAFARDLGHDGPPFEWDAEDRRHRMARLDALYFNLYGLSRDEAAYVLDTFPIVREQDEARFCRYRTRELVLGYMNALAAGDTDTVLAL